MTARIPPVFLFQEGPEAGKPGGLIKGHGSRYRSAQCGNKGYRRPVKPAGRRKLRHGAVREMNDIPAAVQAFLIRGESAAACPGKQIRHLYRIGFGHNLIAVGGQYRQ